MADIFISYKNQDRELVSGLAQSLEAKGFTVWWDTRIEVTEAWLQRIVSEVDKAACLIGIWSANSVEDGLFIPSEHDGINYIQIEHKRADRANVIGLLIDKDRTPLEFEDRQSVNMTDRLNNSELLTGAGDHPAFIDLVNKARDIATPGFVTSLVDELKRERDSINKQLGVAQRRLQDERDAVGELQTEIARKKDDLAALRRQRDVDKARCEQNIADRETQIAGLARNNADLQNEVARVENDAKQLQERLQTVAASHEEEASARELAEQRKEDMQHMVRSLEAERNQLTARLRQEAEKLRLAEDKVRAAELSRMETPLMRYVTLGLACFGAAWTIILLVSLFARFFR
ncbi:MAG: TIR domain-containing protein [Pseudomonadota bacterium]